MSKRSATAEWLEPYTALGVEKCVEPGCSVSEREDPLYSSYCHGLRHAKRVIRFELTDGERAAAAEAEVTALRELIRTAPHSPYCEARASLFPGRCNCWKLLAVGRRLQDETDTTAESLRAEPAPKEKDTP